MRASGPGLAVFLLASTVAAQSDVLRQRVIKHPPRRFPPPTPTVVQTQSATSEVDAAGLPGGTLPNFAAKVAPTPLPAGPPELLLEESKTPSLTPASRALKSPRAPLRMHLKLAVPGALAAGGSPQFEQHSPTHLVTCDENRKGNATSLIHWEAVIPAKKGARLVLGQAWVDLQGCKLAEAQRAEIPLEVVASLDGKPLVYGARVGDELLFVAPWLQANTTHLGVDQVGVAPTLQRGPISMVRMKPIKGGATVFSAPMPRHKVSEWWSGMGLGPESSLATTAPHQLRIDVSQALGEEAPITLLTVLRPVAVQAPPTPAREALFGVAATPLRARPKRDFRVFF